MKQGGYDSYLHGVRSNGSLHDETCTISRLLQATQPVTHQDITSAMDSVVVFLRPGIQ